MMVLVDWFTVGAQVVNFLLLLLLLRHFLYGPILRAMDERAASIAQTLEEAERTRVEAGDARALFDSQNRELQEQHEAMLLQAQEEVSAWRREQILLVREELQEFHERWHATLRQEEEALRDEIGRRIGAQLHLLTHRALNGLADVELEQQILRVFLRQFQQLPLEARQAIAKAARAKGEMVVSSAFDIPVETRRHIQAVLRDQVADNAQVRFETTPELICGVELAIDGYKLSWSLASYLDSVEECIGGVFTGAQDGQSDVREPVELAHHFG